MKNELIAVNDEQARKIKDGMTSLELDTRVIETIKFEKNSKYTIFEVMEFMDNFQNNEIGIDNKKVWGSMKLNHWNPIAYMHEQGWLEDTEDCKNCLTEKGWRYMNDADGVVGVNIDKDKFLLQNYNGSLYWNKQHKNYDKIINEIKDGMKQKEYNADLRSKKPAVSPQTIRMLQGIPGMSVLHENGDDVKRKA